MAENMNFLPRAELLTLEELDRLCSAFIRRGVRRIRLTGGEPLVRRNVMSLFESLGRQVTAGKLQEITLTTNGSRLARHAHELFNCGVRRINVSIDTLDHDKFAKITRWGKLSDVLEGLAAAKDAGLEIKINAVALKGENDDEIHDLISWCGKEGFDLTFIETMPMGEIDEDRTDRYLPLTAVRKKIEKRWTLDDTKYKTGGPSNYAVVRETGKRIGMITPMTHNFCEDCNRVRLTSTGKLYLCLGQDDLVDLRSPLRMSESDDLVLQAIDSAIDRKPQGHDFVIDRSNEAPAVARHMSVTGG